MSGRDWESIDNNNLRRFIILNPFQAPFVGYALANSLGSSCMCFKFAIARSSGGSNPPPHERNHNIQLLRAQERILIMDRLLQLHSVLRHLQNSALARKYVVVQGEALMKHRGKDIGYTGWLDLDGDESAVSIAVIVKWLDG